jgi:hypothetical protein
MRYAIAAISLLAAACGHAPLLPANPAQAVAHERSAATDVAGGVRVVIRPEKWEGYRGDLEEYLTPVEVSIENGSGRAIQLHASSFALRTPKGVQYAALSPQDMRYAVGAWRGATFASYSYYGAPGVGPYFYPWAPTFGPTFSVWNGTHSWWGAVPYYGYGYGLPSRALVKGTLEPGGKTTVVLLFPVPAAELKAWELDASFLDVAGAKVGELRVPFVREGEHMPPMPLPPTAAPPPSAPGQPGAPTWQTEPPANPPGPPPSGPPPQPPVDQPVGPPVESPESTPQ